MQFSLTFILFQIQMLFIFPWNTELFLIQQKMHEKDKKKTINALQLSV